MNIEHKDNTMYVSQVSVSDHSVDIVHKLTFNTSLIRGVFQYHQYLDFVLIGLHGKVFVLNQHILYLTLLLIAALSPPLLIHIAFCKNRDWVLIKMHSSICVADD